MVVIMSLFSLGYSNSIENAQNNNDGNVILCGDDDDYVEVLSAEFDGEKSIVVTVKVYGKGCHDVKVYPTNNGILSSVTSSARTVYCCQGNTAKVTFSCSAKDKDDLQYCEAYYFEAELLN